MDKSCSKIVIFGGNGFIGSHVAQALSDFNSDIVCLSRSGHKPIHLNKNEWSKRVRWCKGDAAQPNKEVLANADAIICCVGSPPLPTLSQKAFDEQLFMNGTTCSNAIKAAADAGVKRVILLNAQIPWVMRSKRFAYYVGKNSALKAASEFCDISSEHSALILQPGMVTGCRVLPNGFNLRLDWLTAPVSPFMPWQFVSVERVAARISDFFMNPEIYHGQCIVLKNRHI